MTLTNTTAWFTDGPPNGSPDGSPNGAPTCASYGSGNAAYRPTHRSWLGRLLSLSAGCLLVSFQLQARNLASYDFDRDDQLATASDYRPWTQLMSKQAAGQEALDACVADAKRCPMYLRGYREVIHAAPKLTRAEQLILVDRFIDRRHWRSERAGADQWQSLDAFLRGGGNCKDFALAKYFVLRALGFPAQELRVVVARQIGKMDHHALLAVRTGSVVQLFDSDDLIYSATNHADYDFLYSINEIALWDHKSRPGALQSADGAGSAL